MGPCNPSPCENGVCVSVNITVASDGSNSSRIMETYNCSCHKGWRGVNCTDDIDECEEKIGMVYSPTIEHFFNSGFGIEFLY